MGERALPGDPPTAVRRYDRHPGPPRAHPAAGDARDAALLLIGWKRDKRPDAGGRLCGSVPVFGSGGLAIVPFPPVLVPDQDLPDAWLARDEHYVCRLSEGSRERSRSRRASRRVRGGSGQERPG
jgi:hypothetical protein